MNKEDLIKLKKKIKGLSLEEKKERDLYLRDISCGKILGPMTGYASIDKPWLKYYDKANIGSKRDNLSAYEYMRNSNKDNMSSKAISYFNESITFNELLDKIDVVSRSLVKLGIKKGDVITLLMANIPENIYLFYAINRLGAIANIIDPRLKVDEIIAAINETKSRNLITIDTFLSSKNIEEIRYNTKVEDIVIINPMTSLKLNSVTRKILFFRQNMSLNYKKNNLLLWEDFLNLGNGINSFDLKFSCEEDVALMVRTGGTTGRPKMVMLTNKNLNEMANQHALGGYNFKKQDVFLNFLPPFIAYGICCAVHMPLALGLELRLIPKFDAKEFPRLMKKYNPNVVFGGPILYEKMMLDFKTKHMDLSKLKVPVSGGDTMNVELEKNINKYFRQNNCYHPIGQGYGMTEVSSSCCYSKEEAYCLGSVGIPLINNNIAIIDLDTMEEVQYDNEGEICIKSDTAMKGYLNNEFENQNIKKVHEDGTSWIHTGDIGKINSLGNLFVIGRIKRMIVSNGSKIFPQAIENIINRHPSILSSTVVGASHKNLRTVPIAHIVLKNEDDDVDKIVSDLECEIKKELPDYYLPYIYKFRKEMPLTSINKVDYKALEEETYSYNSKIIVDINQNKIKKLIRRC